MNTDKLTTILGCIIAALIAAKPYLDGSGYHLDTKTGMELSMAVLSAVYGFITNKQSKGNDKGATD